MATSTVSPASSNIFAPVTLNAVSQYSSDLQSILTRAGAIAQIPIQYLQNQDATVLSQESVLGGLQSAVGSLADSLTSLGTLAASQGLSATSSDPSSVTATVTGATAPTSYTINSVTSAASAATEHSQNFFADSTSTPVSSTGTMDLLVGSTHHVFTLTNNSLIGVRDQINSLNAGVTASILTTAGGNYLAVAANATGATTLQLIDDPITAGNPGGASTNILTSSNQGTDAVFQLNGINVRQPGNTVNSVIPGVTLNIVGATNSPLTVTLASDSSQLSSALQSFVSSYNSVQSAVTAQEGTSGGPLNGDHVVTQLAGELRQLASYYNSSGSINSLADLGVTFNDATGQASFDPTVLSGLSGTQLSDAFKFVGSATAGLGGFSASFTQFSDPISGIIKIEADGLAQTDQSLQTQITDKTDRANAVQAALASRLEAADAALAQLQSQQQTLTGSLQALSLVIYGQNPNPVA
jgi:flagellar hook-associated protein 2